MTFGSNLDTLDLLRSSANVLSPGEGEASAGWGKGSVIPNLALTASERAVTSGSLDPDRKVYSVFSTVFLLLLLLAVAVGCPAACFGR